MNIPKTGDFLYKSVLSTIVYLKKKTLKYFFAIHYRGIK